MVSKAVVIGIDIGAAESYVAYVGKGVVDVVQNEVSKRATPSLVGFTERERLLGDAALAQIRSNAKNSCRNFKHLLGRQITAPDVQSEHFWSTSALCECADGHAGYEVTYKGEQRQFSAVEVTAMFLSKLRDIAEKWCEGKVTDVVVAVPSSYADVQRQALLDAAKVANLTVLRVMNEHTATALAYGIYRSNDFDPEKPQTVAFCSMGHSIFSVSIVRFVRGRLTVLCERSDKVGGREMDECLMRTFAAEFQQRHGCDPLSSKKSAYKLEDAVAKTKKILSANSQANVTCECLMEDHDFSSEVTREDLERMCEPAIARVRAVLEAAKAASGLTNEQIDSVEIVGGGSRVPWVKRVCSEAFGGKELSTTMNQEESVARGCALQAAMLSPLYKVRDFKVEDVSPFAINVGWVGAASSEAGELEPDGDQCMGGAEGEYKTSTVFPAGSAMGVLKMLTFYRKGPFEIKAEYADEQALLPGTPKGLGTFRIELPPQAEARKVKVRVKLTLHGTFAVEGAQLVEEEEYEDVVMEKRELPADPAPAPEAEPGADAEMKDAEAPAEAQEGGGEGREEREAAKKEPEKKFEWVEVKKTKRRAKKTDLAVTASGTPGLSAEQLQKLADAETAMQSEMREIMETDERRNDVEAYIFSMRDKVCQGGEYGAFMSDADREAFCTELTQAEDWLFDNPDATKAAYVEKLIDLKRTGDAVAWRAKEHGMRGEWVEALQGTIRNYRAAAEQPGEKFGHIAPEKLAAVAAACSETESWLRETQAKQDATPMHEKPVLLCAEMEKRNQDLAKMADDILREPKPAPPKEEKKATSPKAEEEKREGEERRKEEEAARKEVD